MKRLAIVCAAAAALLAPAAVASAQDQAVATLDRATPVAAFGGRLLWSRLDRPSGDWSLVTRAGGVTERVPVAPRRVPFDADLGPGPDGATVAVYSRCRRDPPAGGGFAPPLYNRGRGCDVYLYDFAAGAERRLANASAPSASEFFPTIWRGTLAFGRTYDDKPNHPYIYARPVNGTATSERLPGGARQACRRDPSTGRTSCSDDTLSRPMGLELYGRRLAFAWTFLGFSEGLDTEIRMDTLGGGHTRVAHQDGGGLTQVQHGWPAFESGSLYWSIACYGDGAGCPGRYGLRRYRVTTRATQRADAPAAVLGHDRDAGLSFLLVDAAPGTDCLGDPEVPGGTCTLRAVAPVWR
jgi:opacity protein-like surface antigen